MPSSQGVEVGPNDKINLGLERMLRLTQHLMPSKSGLVELPAIHIAGTNGKGSVSAMLEAALLANNLRVGRYNSPHLVTIRDCIRLNGHCVSLKAYAGARRRVEAANDEIGIGASPFEVLTTTAFLIFKKSDEALDVVIIECGMGGARDATNILAPENVWAYILTQVDLDHQAFLGDTVEKIAKEKAGIVPSSAVIGGKARLVVGAQTHDGIRDVVERHVHECQSQAVFVARPKIKVPSRSTPFSLHPLHLPPALTISFDSGDGEELYDVPLPGTHQADNLATALRVLLEIKKSREGGKSQLPSLDEAKIKSGIKRTQWAGRCSWLESQYGPVLVDGAHNGAASSLLRNYIDYINQPNGTNLYPITFIISLSHSPPKTTDSVISPLIKPGSSDLFIFLEFSTPVEGMPWVKPVPASTLKASVPELQTWSPSADAGSVEALEQSLEFAQGRKGLTVVCGSLYLVADVYRLCAAQS